MSYLSVWFEWEGTPPSDEDGVYYVILKHKSQINTNYKLDLVKTILRDGVFDSRSEAFYSVFEGDTIDGWVFVEDNEIILAEEPETRRVTAATWVRLKNVNN